MLLILNASGYCPSIAPLPVLEIMARMILFTWHRVVLGTPFCNGYKIVKMIRGILWFKLLLWKTYRYF